MTGLAQTLSLTKKSILANEGTHADALGNAVGNYQFGANQWLQIRYQQNSALFSGLDPVTISTNPVLRDTILKQRLDPQIAESAMDYQLSVLVTTYQAQGVTVTPGSLYAGVIFGAVAAATLFSSVSVAGADQILDPATLNKARGFTVQPDGSYRTVPQVRSLLEKYASSAGTSQPSYTSSNQVTTQRGVQGTGLSALEAMVLSGMMQHQGLAANGQLIQNINLLQSSHITGQMYHCFQTAKTLPANQAITVRMSTLGASSISSLIGTVPASLTQLQDDRLNQPVKDVMAPLNALLDNSAGWPNLIQQAASLGGLSGLLKQVTDNTILPMQGNYTGFMHIIMTCNGLNKMTNNIIPSASEAASQKFGNNVGGLGANFRNMNDVISYGTTALTRDLSAAAQELVDMGTWNMQDLVRLQTSGTVTRQIIDRGLGNSLDLYNKLVDIKVPVADVENPAYAKVLQTLLDGYNDSNSVQLVSTTFNMYKKIDKLGQLTDISYMLPTLVTSTGYADFAELGSHLQSLGINRSGNFQKLGYLIGQIDPGTDLNHLSQLDTPAHNDSTDFLINHFGYGGGTFGELTMADFIGTAAGYVHNDTLPYIIQANDALMELPEGTELANRINKLLNLLVGNYTSGGNYVVPGLSTYTNLYDAVDAVCANIENQLAVVKALTGGIATRIQAAEKAHSTSYSQVIKENLHMIKMSFSLFQDHGMGAQGIMSFCNNIKNYATDNGYGQIGEYLEHVVTDDLTGDAIRAILKQGRNAALLAEVGVDIKKFQLPQSKYYTDPQGFYLQAYTGTLPVTPANLQDPITPVNSADVYLEYRNSLLSKAGYDVRTMNKAVADETYMDLLMGRMSDKIREQVGLGVVRQVVDRNLYRTGNDFMLIDPAGKSLQVANLSGGKITVTDRGNLTTILMILANKCIYGNVGTSKSNNPLNTDKMVYGVVEMMEYVTASNVDQLGQTLLGHYVMKNFLSDIRDLIRGISNTLDTSMDRNDPQVWADAGPASTLKIT